MNFLIWSPSSIAFRQHTFHDANDILRRSLPLQLESAFNKSTFSSTNRHLLLPLRKPFIGFCDKLVEGKAFGTFAAKLGLVGGAVEFSWRRIGLASKAGRGWVKEGLVGMHFARVAGSAR